MTGTETIFAFYDVYALWVLISTVASAGPNRQARDSLSSARDFIQLVWEISFSRQLLSYMLLLLSTRAVYQICIETWNPFQSGSTVWWFQKTQWEGHINFWFLLLQVRRRPTPAVGSGRQWWWTGTNVTVPCPRRLTVTWADRRKKQIVSLVNGSTI